MKKLTFVASLTARDNDYQREQAAAVEATARRLDVNVQVIFAGNDSTRQGEQILESFKLAALH